MPLFKKKSEVPPVDADAARNDLLGGGRASRNNPHAGEASSGGSGSGPSSRQGSYSGTSNPGSGGYYAGAGASMRAPQPGSDTRAELFRNAKAPNERWQNADIDRPEDYQTQEQDDEDDEVEAIKQQMRFTKQESLASTRNALRAAREAEETARGTLGKLGDQTERLANVDRSLDMAKAYDDRARDEAKEIAALNRSIFRPTFVWNKEKKRNAEEERIMARHVAEQERREENRQMRADSQKNINDSINEASKKPSFGRWGAGSNNSKSAQYGEASNQQSKMASRARYQFEADEEDDRIEDELDQNLDEIGDFSRRLNLMARAAGDEVRQQNNTLAGLNDKTDNVDQQIFRSTQRLARLK